MMKPWKRSRVTSNVTNWLFRELLPISSKFFTRQKFQYGHSWYVILMSGCINAEPIASLKSPQAQKVINIWIASIVHPILSSDPSNAGLKYSAGAPVHVLRHRLELKIHWCSKHWPNWAGTTFKAMNTVALSTWQRSDDLCSLASTYTHSTATPVSPNLLLVDGHAPITTWTGVVWRVHWKYNSRKG